MASEACVRDLNDSGCVQDETTNLPTEPPEYRPVELLDLSDDVLLYIFKFCTHHDLKALAFTHPRIARLALEWRLWTTVDVRDVSYDKRRLLWLLKYALSERTTTLAVCGFAKQAARCADYEEEMNDDEPIDGSGNIYGNTTPPKVDPKASTQKKVIECPDPHVTLTKTLVDALAVQCQLTSLYLEYCNINLQSTSLDTFPVTLKRLSLKGTRCYNQPRPHKNLLFKLPDHLPDLEYVNLAECAWLGPSALLALSKLTKLKELYLMKCPKMTDFLAYAALATRFGFPALELVDYRGSPVSDSELSSFSAVASLRVLRCEAIRPSRTRGREHSHEITTMDWELQEPEHLSRMQINSDIKLDMSEDNIRFYRPSCDPVSPLDAENDQGGNINGMERYQLWNGNLILRNWNPNAGNGGQSVENGGPNAGNGGPNAGNRSPSAGNGGPSAGNGGPSAGNGVSSAGNGGPSAGNGGPNAGNRGPNAGSGSAVTSHERSIGQVRYTTFRRVDFAANNGLLNWAYNRVPIQNDTAETINRNAVEIVLDSCNSTREHVVHIDSEDTNRINEQSEAPPAKKRRVDEDDSVNTAGPSSVCASVSGRKRSASDMDNSDCSRDSDENPRESADCSRDSADNSRDNDDNPRDNSESFIDFSNVNNCSQASDSSSDSSIDSADNIIQINRIHNENVPINIRRDNNNRGNIEFVIERPRVVRGINDNGRDMNNIPRHPVIYFGEALAGNRYVAPQPNSALLVTDSAVLMYGSSNAENVNVIHLSLNNRPASRPRALRSTLEELVLNGYSMVTDRSLVHLATAAPRLRLLDLRRTNVTQDGVDKFKCANPDCEVLFSKFEESDGDNER